jgi:hypothetical protein
MLSDYKSGALFGGIANPAKRTNPAKQAGADLKSAPQEFRI